MTLNRRQFFAGTIGAAIAAALPWRKARPVEWTMNTTIDGAAMRARLRGAYNAFAANAHPSQTPAKCIQISQEAFEAVAKDMIANERFTTEPSPGWEHALAFKDTRLVADLRLSGMDFSVLPRGSDYGIERASFKFWRNTSGPVPDRSAQ